MVTPPRPAGNRHAHVSDEAAHKILLEFEKQPGADGAARALYFMGVTGQLKHIRRRGWILCDVPEREQESIADHMYRMATTVLILESEVSRAGDDTRLAEWKDIDYSKCMRMALVHDIGEAVVGDITPSCGVSADEKLRLECEAMCRICSLLNKTEPESTTVYQLFQDYEKRLSRESKIVKDLDMLDMLVQGHDYERCGAITTRNLQQFFDNTPRDKFSHPLMLDWYDRLFSERQKYLHDAVDNSRK